MNKFVNLLATIALSVYSWFLFHYGYENPEVSYGFLSHGVINFMAIAFIVAIALYTLACFIPAGGGFRTAVGMGSLVAIYVLLILYHTNLFYVYKNGPESIKYSFGGFSMLPSFALLVSGMYAGVGEYDVADWSGWISIALAVFFLILAFFISDLMFIVGYVVAGYSVLKILVISIRGGSTAFGY